MQKKKQKMKPILCTSLLLIITVSEGYLPDIPHVSAQAASQSGASQIRIVCNRWPDGSSMNQFSTDAIRLMNAQTNEEKALAVWRFIRMWSARTDGNVPTEPAINDTYIDDPIKVLNVYGAHHCDGLSRAMEIAWRSLGYRAEKLYRSGHTQANAFWKDEDGQSRWHLMDVSQGWYVYDRTGGHIATPDEIGADYSLIFRPSKGFIPANPHYWGLHNWIHAPHLIWPVHSMNLNLRINEYLTRFWGNVSLPYQDNYAADAKGDLEHGPYPVTYGNGIFQYAPDFTSAEYKKGLWVPQINVMSVAEDGLSPNLHPSRVSSTATVIFHIESPYIISDAWISGTLYRKTPSDNISLFISTDSGKSWKTVWEADTIGLLSLDKINIADKFDLYKPYPPGFISPFGRYRYLLKAEFSAANNISDVGLDNLNITTVTQHNIFSLPQLWPGENRITVSGNIANDTSLRIIYEWQDLLGSDRRSIAIVENTPSTYIINTYGKKWDDVITKSVIIEAVPKIGNGNYLALREKQPPTLINITQEQTFATPQIVGTIAPSPLKTASQYIADLNDPAKQVQALSALIVLKDKVALEAITRVAFESIAYPNKDLAIQALYLIGGEDSIPILLEIVKKNAAVKWKYDPSDRFVELGHWYNISAMIGQLMADANEISAVPALMAVLDSIIQNDDRSWEPHAGLIRSLGRLRQREACRSIRPFLGRHEDVSTIAIWALGELEDYESAEAIKDIFINTSYKVRKIAAAEALGKLKYQGVFDNLCSLLADPDENMRASAAEALGRLGNPMASPYLRNLINIETFPWVREIAEASLSVLNNKIAAPTGLRLASR
jgi:HEAT repeat protein